MSRFLKYVDKTYINEGISAGNLGKAILNIKKVVERSLSSKLLPFYGSNEIESFTKTGSKGLGIMYIVDKQDSLVRFNWEQKKKSNTITSVDIWNNVTDVDIKPPVSTLDIPKDYNIIQSIGIIVNFIKKPRIGTVSESQFILEAKGDKKRALALEYGLDPDMKYNDVQKAVRKKKKLIATKGVQETNQVMTDIKDAQKALDAQKYADPDIVFDDLDDLIRMVAANIQPSLLVTGMAGIGKTYSVTQLLQSMLGSEGQKWVHVKGKLSPMGMYSTFFLNRDKLIVFDDADSVFANQDTVNMLKAALDSYEKRTISWVSPKTVDVSRLDDESIEKLYADIEDKLADDPSGAKFKFPNRFDFSGQVIFISNIHANKIDSAVKSRSLTIDITLSSQDVVKRLRSIIKHLGGDLDISEKEEVLVFLEENYKGELNIRSFILGCRCKQSGSSNWKRLIKYA